MIHQKETQMSLEQMKDVQFHQYQIFTNYVSRQQLYGCNLKYLCKKEGIKKQVPVLAVEQVLQTLGGHVCNVHEEPSQNTCTLTYFLTSWCLSCETDHRLLAKILFKYVHLYSVYNNQTLGTICVEQYRIGYNIACRLEAQEVNTEKRQFLLRPFSEFKRN